MPIETDIERQFQSLFATDPTLEDALKRRIDLARKAYEYSKGDTGFYAVTTTGDRECHKPTEEVER